MVTSRLSPSRSGWRQVRPHNQKVGRARPGQWFRASECRVPKSTQQRNVLVRTYRYHNVATWIKVYVDSSPHTQPRRRRGDVWKAVLVFSHDTKHSRHQLRSTVQISLPYYRERPSVAGRARTVIADMQLTRFGEAKTGGASRVQGRISVSEGPKGARNHFLTRREMPLRPHGRPEKQYNGS